MALVFLYYIHSIKKFYAVIEPSTIIFVLVKTILTGLFLLCTTMRKTFLSCDDHHLFEYSMIRKFKKTI